MCPHPHQTRWLLMPLVLSFSCLLLAVAACTLPGSAVRATYPPGGNLRLSIDIEYQFTHLDLPDVQVLVRFVGEGELAPADAATVTCNGRDVTPRQDGFLSNLGPARPCTRESPGGTYRFVYTDEHGATTSALIPVPVGSLTIRSPADGAAVPIARTDGFLLRLALPIPAPGGNVTIDAIDMGSCSPYGTTQSCNEYLAGPKTANQTPAVMTAVASAVATGVTTHGGECTFQIEGFSASPGRGGIFVSVKIDEPAQQSGFADSSITFRDTAEAAFTWVEPT